MKTNIGIVDKAVRILAAIIIIVLYFINVIGGTLAIVLLIFAGVFILTALIRFCPLYWPFRINTWNKK